VIAVICWGKYGSEYEYEYEYEHEYENEHEHEHEYEYEYENENEYENEHDGPGRLRAAVDGSNSPAARPFAPPPRATTISGDERLVGPQSLRGRRRCRSSDLGHLGDRLDRLA
jgi:hypothetical protein